MNKKISIIVLILLVLFIGVGYFFYSYFYLPRIIEESSFQAESCIDSDGNNIYIQGILKYVERGIEKGEEEGCYYNSPGGKNIIYENYCEGNIIKSIKSTCGWGKVCIKGACVQDTGQGNCIEEDGGKNIYKKSTTLYGKMNGIDVCSIKMPEGYDSTRENCSGKDCIIIEYFCDLDKMVYEKIPCPSGCVDGACI